MHTKRPLPAQAPQAGLVLVPAPKRPHVDAAAGGGVASPRGKRQLRSGMLVLFFVAQVKEEMRYNQRLRRVIRGENAISQQRAIQAFDCVFQKAFDNAFQKHLDPIYRSLQSLNKRTDILSHEVEQIKHSNSNHHANQQYRSKANQESAAITEEVNQEQTAARFVTREAQEGQRVELRFLNKLNPLVFTKEKITAEDGTAIKIAIVRDNQIITSGPLSSARIEILALHGNFYDVVPDNWTESEFDHRIVSSSQGPALGGVCQVKLKNGEASPSDVFFNIPSSKTESGRLIVAAKVHTSDNGGLRIKEAVMMNPVVVQVYRNKLNRSSDRPKLKDEVHRLKGISGKGCRTKWLKDNQINTVEEFVKALNKDEEKIRNECFKLKKDNKLWKDTIKHAKECDLEGNCKLKLYRAEEQHVVLFFNCVHDLVGAKFRDHYVAKDNFSSDQQDAVNRLKKQAYDELDSIGFDHEMKNNYPVMTLSDDGYIPFTDTAQNPPDLHVTFQVQGIAAAEIYHEHELPQAFPNNNNDFGQDFLHGFQGALTQMDHDYAQFGIADMQCYTTRAPEGTSYGGNNMIGPANVPQNVIGDGSMDMFDCYAYIVPDNENQNERPHSSAYPGPAGVRCIIRYPLILAEFLTEQADLKVCQRNQSDMIIEVCCCLGFAANVAQLAGLDVASLVKEIKERVQTVSQNKEDCELLAERAELILDLLGRLQKSKVIEDPDMWKPTERLRSTLRRACEVIEFCRERSCTYRFCKSDHTAKELRKVLKALKFCVTHLTALATIINGDQTTRYFLVQQTPDVVQLQDGVQVPALGLPAQHFKYNDRNDRGETLGISGKAQLVTEPSSVNEPGERATKEPLDWPKRSQIVRGIAQGAVYLHKLCEPRIIHGDLKPGNILLDASLKPKICDFGISKALKADADKDCTGVVVGSRGFMAPEYKQGGCLSLQTDVYSFGATLLQIIRGKHISPSSLALSDESRNYGPLNKWAWNLWKDGNLMELIDPSLHDETHAAEIKRWVQIALLCVQQSPEERPSMWDVLLMLSCDSVILPEPKLPAYH
uniref:Protein kinase domain-containing protein n=1 Tax=Oryza nivara TaxID=4536 RepID=A0A0E0J589_ORYNI